MVARTAGRKFVAEDGTVFSVAITQSSARLPAPIEDFLPPFGWSDYRGWRRPVKAFCVNVDERNSLLRFESDFGLAIAEHLSGRVAIHAAVISFGPATLLLPGRSGSGKSTLTSAITGKKILSKALSNNQGVHTTSVSTLYHAHEMKIIDSPGVRDIGIDHLKPKEIILGFPEIINYALNCTFPNCSHQTDEGCEVIAALKNGDIEESRYNNFIFLSNQEKTK